MSPAISTATSSQRAGWRLPRPHLVEELLSHPRRLRLLCAPAGYGKTALIRECLGQTAAPAHQAHLNLAGQPLTLPELCARIAQQLGTSASGPMLLQYLENLSGPIRLVIDDYPDNADSAVDAWLDQLLLHSSAPVELWVSCRQRPRWNLPRLMLDGELLVLESSRLALSRLEYDALVDLSAPALSPEYREEYWQQTLGWAAGACLLLNSGLGVGHLLQDYLERELLGRLETDERQILIGFAYLPRFSPTLCDQLWEDQRGKAVLQRLLQAQSFIQPINDGGEWYRLLPSIARSLKASSDSASHNRLRLNACRHLSNLGYLDEAIELAIEAGYPEVAANYLARLRPSWLLSNDNLQLLLGWAARLPQALLESEPNLIVLFTSALLMSARHDEAQAQLERLERYLPQPSETENHRLLCNWQALYGAILGQTGNAIAAREHCVDALRELGDEERHVAPFCVLTLARLAMANGEGPQAQQILMDALERARRNGCLTSEILINSERVCLLTLSGEQRLADLLLHESLALLHADGNRHRLLRGRLLLIRGKIQLHRNELEASESSLREALLHGRDCVMHVLHTLIGLSEVFTSRGELEEAFRYLQETERRMQCADAQQSSYRSVINLQSLNILVRQRNWAQALPLGRQIEEYLRGQIARTASMQVPSMLVRSQWLLALAEQGVGRGREAEKRLLAVLRECQRLGFRGLAVKVQRKLSTLVQDSAPAPMPAAVESFNLLVGEPAPRRSDSTQNRRVGTAYKRREELTTREVSVLELLAEGLSNQEIGERLYISTNTVKAHTKHINTKLGVTRRTQAVVRAKALGMLT